MYIFGATLLAKRKVQELLTGHPIKRREISGMRVRNYIVRVAQLHLAFRLLMRFTEGNADDPGTDR
jgi:hypothetical protein